MTEGGLTRPELVVHLFYAADRERAQRSVDRMRRVWAAGVDVLAATEPVAGYPDELPAAAAGFGESTAPAAIRRHPHRAVQLVARRVRNDMLMLSVLIAPESGHGWDELDLSWDRVLARANVETPLGVRRLFLAKVPGDVTDLALAGPPSTPGAVTKDGRCAVWPLEPTGALRDMRLAVLAREGDDDALTRFTWWRGEREIPRLTRFLSCSVRVRDQFLVWDHGSHTQRFREETDRALGMLRQQADQGLRRAAVERLRELSVDIGTATSRLAELERTVEISLANAGTAIEWRDGPDIPGTLPAVEANLARGLRWAVADDRVYLEAVGARAAIHREFEHAFTPRVTTGPTGLFVRMGFHADIIGFGTRPPADRTPLKRRFNELFHAVFDRMFVDPGTSTVDTDGDRTIGLFPVITDPSVALPELITTTALLLAEDNRRHTDRLAFRMSVGLGLVSHDGNGFGGALVTELARLTDCRQLRDASAESGAPLAVIVQHGLFQQVVSAGYPLPDGMEFREVNLRMKEYDAVGFIWCGPPAQTA